MPQIHPAMKEIMWFAPKPKNFEQLEAEVEARNRLTLHDSVMESDQYTVREKCNFTWYMVNKISRERARLEREL